ncbi:hypothetical protein FPV67DRAFT_1456597 [Lyophyllum atratum]|nr:hypothetical protein FPV67DRAFT_1456597 [Lyophyllum atratum]
MSSDSFSRTFREKQFSGDNYRIQIPNVAPNPLANVPVDDSGRARLAEFGMFSVSDSNIPAWTIHSSVASQGGSVRWQAPELINPGKDEEVKNRVKNVVYALFSSRTCVGGALLDGVSHYCIVIHPRDVRVDKPTLRRVMVTWSRVSIQPWSHPNGRIVQLDANGGDQELCRVIRPVWYNGKTILYFALYTPSETTTPL